MNKLLYILILFLSSCTVNNYPDCPDDCNDSIFVAKELKLKQDSIKLVNFQKSLYNEAKRLDSVYSIIHDSLVDMANNNNEFREETIKLHDSLQTDIKTQEEQAEARLKYRADTILANIRKYVKDSISYSSYGNMFIYGDGNGKAYFDSITGHPKIVIK